MKLAEALFRRADAQKRIQQLRQRLMNNTLVQEGEEPAENPNQLLEELSRTLSELTQLVKQINQTNIVTPFDEARTLTDVLAERDAIMWERNILVQLVQVTSLRQPRVGRSEVKFIRTVDVAEIQQRADALAQQHRELDTQIQALNWQTELVEQ